MAPQIPILPLKTILLAHLLLFSLAMYVSPLSPSWFWTNLGILILLLRLLEAPAVPGATDAAPQIAEILVYLYTFTVINDIICFSISPDGLSPGQTFSLTMACFSMIMKPFVVPSLLLDMKNRGGALGGSFVDTLGQGGGGHGGGGGGGSYSSIPSPAGVGEEVPVYGGGGGGGNTIV